uniref:Uncharacterized protein n=1 Tax=Panagrolaimus sp. ES5 TaxID=591445 RepID=A0AC34FUY6_9BILA
YSYFNMQLRAYVTINGAMPTRSCYPFLFEVQRFPTFALSSSVSTYKVSKKRNTHPDVTLEDGADMVVVVDHPSGDASFQLPAASPSRSQHSQSQPSTPRPSQSTSMDTSYVSLFDGSSPRPCTSQQSLTSAPTATAFVSTAASNEAMFMAQVNALLGSSSLAPASELGPPETLPVPANTLLLAVYFSQRQAVEGGFPGMKPDEVVSINNVDVHAFFDVPVRKAALVVLQNPMDHSMEIRDDAKCQAKRSLVELLVRAYPEYNCPTRAIQPVTKILGSCNW